MTPDYMRGYLQGVYKGDGYFSWRGATLQNATIRLNDKRIIDRICEYVEKLYGYTCKVRTATNQAGNVHYQINWAPKTLKLDPAKLPTSAEERRGWLAGFYDAEGCHSLYNLTMSQRKREPLDLIASILDEHGFKYGFYESGQNSISRWVIRISSLTDNHLHWRFFGTFETIRR